MCPQLTNRQGGWGSWLFGPSGSSWEGGASGPMISRQGRLFSRMVAVERPTRRAPGRWWWAAWLLFAFRLNHEIVAARCVHGIQVCWRSQCHACSMAWLATERSLQAFLSEFVRGVTLGYPLQRLRGSAESACGAGARGWTGVPWLSDLAVLKTCCVGADNAGHGQCSAESCRKPVP